jgi:hypothetical protein
MRLAMTLTVRNEADILQANLDYHFARGVDVVIATENNSEDETPDILERYARRGLVHVIHESADDYPQSEWVTRMARMAATEHEADWVINNDADEFWWPKAPGLKEIFAAVPAEFGVLTAPRINFVPRPEASGAFFERMTVAEVRGIPSLEEWRAWKADESGAQGTQKLNWHPHFSLPKVAHRGLADVEVGDGNHSARGPGLRPVPGWHPVDVLHFPLRDYAQFERNAGRGSERKRALYRRHQAEELRDQYRAYVVDSEQVEVGLREGRLIVDRRLGRFLAELGAGASSGATSAGTTPGTVPDEETDPLTADMLRAITLGEWFEREAQSRERKREQLERRLQKERGSHERTAARLEKATAKLARAQAGRAAGQGRPGQRLLRRIGALRRSGTPDGDRP